MSKYSVTVEMHVTFITEVYADNEHDASYIASEKADVYLPCTHILKEIFSTTVEEEAVNE